MEINASKKFSEHDIFVDFKLEKVMFRWDYSLKKVYRKFYGEQESKSDIPASNNLYNEALLYGDEINYDDYLLGKQ